MIIEEFEPDVFRQLIEYIHTGCLTLQPRTLLGVMNAADYYGLDELKHACSGFIQVSGLERLSNTVKILLQCGFIFSFSSLFQ